MVKLFGMIGCHRELVQDLRPDLNTRITKMLKNLAKSGKIPARGTTPGRVLEDSLMRGLNEELEVGGPLRTTRNVRLGRA